MFREGSSKYMDQSERTLSLDWGSLPTALSYQVVSSGVMEADALCLTAPS